NLKRIALFITGISVFTLASQGQSGEKERDQSYSPPAGSVFDEKRRRDYSGNGSANHAILFENMLLFRGVLGLTYRHKLPGNPVSFGFSAGHVFGKDLYFGYLNEYFGMSLSDDANEERELGPSEL